jgi:hypothetical protein
MLCRFTVRTSCITYLRGCAVIKLSKFDLIWPVIGHAVVSILEATQIKVTHHPQKAATTYIQL